MGVDAEMFLRIKGRDKWLDDKAVLTMSVRLAKVVGHKTFWITKGLSKEERIGTEEHHALSIIKPHDRAYYESEYGTEWIEENLADYEPLFGKVVWTQDGDPIIADDDEQFIKVHMWGRFYGEGYARGHWPTIRDIATFLKIHGPSGSTVWYGGDSSGCVAELFDASLQAKLDKLWFSSGNDTYQAGWSSLFGGRSKPVICPCCEVPMESNGGGQGLSMLYCDGCGRQGATDGSGAHVIVRKQDLPNGKNSMGFEMLEYFRQGHRGNYVPPRKD